MCPCVRSQIYEFEAPYGHGKPMLSLPVGLQNEPKLYRMLTLSKVSHTIAIDCLFGFITAKGPTHGDAIPGKYQVHLQGLHPKKYQKQASSISKPEDQPLIL